MNQQEQLDQIKSIIIMNLASNESIVADVYTYNDVVQCNTYIAFTPLRIFYWHADGETAKVKTKSYNLIQSVFSSSGVLSIHFNDEILKLLISKDSDDYKALSGVLLEHIQITNLSANTAKKPSKRPKNNKQRVSRIPKMQKYSARDVFDRFRMVFVAIAVVAISFLGTIAWIYGEQWISSLNKNDGLTAEKLAEINKNIEVAQKRVFTINEAEQMLVSYQVRLVIVSNHINEISPSDRLYNWDDSWNFLSNHKLSLLSLSPEPILDSGPYFEIERDLAQGMVQGTYAQLSQLIDTALSGVEGRFSDISDLVRLRQDLSSLETKIAELSSRLENERGLVDAYIQEQKELIQRN